MTVDALFDQAGVIRTDSLAELLDVASLLANQPLPAWPTGGDRHQRRWARDHVRRRLPGGRSRGADAAATGCRTRLREGLAPEASLANPVDMIATASAEQYRKTITTLAEWEGIDALIVIFIRPLLTRAEDVAEAVRDACAGLSRRDPGPGCLHVGAGSRGDGRGGGVPRISIPRTPSGRSAGLCATSSGARSRDGGAGCDRRRRCDGAPPRDRQGSGGRWRMARSRRSPSCSTATGSRCPNGARLPTRSPPVTPRKRLGGRVALKAAGPAIVHKTDLDAVRVGLEGAAEVSWAAVEMDEALSGAGVERQSFIVQSMVEVGTELLVGVVSDPVFGPVLACGAGGTQAELLKDVTVRICPLTAQRLTR